MFGWRLAPLALVPTLTLVKWGQESRSHMSGATIWPHWSELTRLGFPQAFSDEQTH